MLRSVLYVAFGGAIGSVFRFLFGLLVQRWWTTEFPLSTFLVNALGCLLIGLLAGASQRSPWLAGPGWALLVTGLCGGFTTFSTFALEGTRLMRNGASGIAFVYMLASVITGLILCAAGVRLASRL
jgi:CrcB protein